MESIWGDWNRCLVRHRSKNSKRLRFFKQHLLIMKTNDLQIHFIINLCKAVSLWILDCWNCVRDDKLKHSFVCPLFLIKLMPAYFDRHVNKLVFFLEINVSHDKPIGGKLLNSLMPSHHLLSLKTNFHLKLREFVSICVDMNVSPDQIPAVTNMFV